MQEKHGHPRSTNTSTFATQQRGVTQSQGQGLTDPGLMSSITWGHRVLKAWGICEWKSCSFFLICFFPLCWAVLNIWEALGRGSSWAHPHPQGSESEQPIINLLLLSLQLWKAIFPFMLLDASCSDVLWHSVLLSSCNLCRNNDPAGIHGLPDTVQPGWVYMLGSQEFWFLRERSWFGHNTLLLPYPPSQSCSEADSRFVSRQLWEKTGCSVIGIELQKCRGVPVLNWRSKKASWRREFSSQTQKNE